MALAARRRQGDSKRGAAVDFAGEANVAPLQSEVCAFAPASARPVLLAAR